MVGAFSPYLSLYFASVGMTIAQIGVLMAVPQLTRIFGPPIWGWAADRFGRRALILRLSSAAAVAASLGLLLAGGHYGAALVVLAAMYFATSAQVPLAETMALSVSAGDSGRYGRIRLWGSIGFVCAVAFAGPLLDAVGVRWLPLVMTALAACLLAVAWRVPEPPARAAGTGAADSVWRRLREPAIAAFFASSFLMMFAHAALYGFFSLYLDGLGWTKSAIGLAWTIGVLAEIVLFRVQRRLFERFDALWLLAASLAVAAARFEMLGWGGGAVAVVVVVQLLHAVTFGVHHSAVMALLHRWFEPVQQSRAQALYITLGYGLGGACGGVVASRLWEHVGPTAAFHGAAFAAALGWACVAWCRRMQYARPDGQGNESGG